MQSFLTYFSLFCIFFIQTQQALGVLLFDGFVYVKNLTKIKEKNQKKILYMSVFVSLLQYLLKQKEFRNNNFKGKMRESA